MCEGTAPDEQVMANGQQNRRRLRRRRREEPRRSALDAVPPVATLDRVWRSANDNIKYITPQHLGTAVAVSTPDDSSIINFSAPPFLFHEQYLVGGCQNGQICFWNLSGQFPALINGNNDDDSSAAIIDTLVPISPQIVIDGEGGAPIVQFTQATTAALLDNSDDRSSTLVALDALGTITVISETITVLVQWNTGTCGGVRSIATTEQGRIVVGYDCGNLEAWKLVVMKLHDPPAPTSKSAALPKVAGKQAKAAASPVAAALKQQKKMTVAADDAKNHGRQQQQQWTPKLLWKATFRDQNPSITAVAQLCVQPNVVREQSFCGKDTNCDNEVEDENQHHEYLVLTLQRNDSQPRTASMVEVVDAKSIETAWWAYDGTNNDEADPSVAVALEDHWVLPQAGREIVDASTVPPALLMPNHWIPSQGTNGLCSTTDWTAAGLSDGMVVVLSASFDKQQQQQLQWGVSLVTDQNLLSYPPIGIASVEFDDCSYVACSLRGTATYLIPVDETANSPLLGFSVPHDIDEDATVRHIQGFGAGNVIVSQSQQSHNELLSHRRIPLLLYAWPGGVTDIYSCGLLSNINQKFDHSMLLEELIDNGSVEILRTIINLQSDGESSCDVVKTDWEDARQEVALFKETGSISMEDICSDRLKAFRSVLIQLSS